MRRQFVLSIDGKKKGLIGTDGNQTNSRERGMSREFRAKSDPLAATHRSMEALKPPGVAVQIAVRVGFGANSRIHALGDERLWRLNKYDEE